jgi:hypothetical protein
MERRLGYRFVGGSGFVNYGLRELRILIYVIYDYVIYGNNFNLVSKTSFRR